jgi:hypothetical protein
MERTRGFSRILFNANLVVESSLKSEWQLTQFNALSGEEALQIEQVCMEILLDILNQFYRACVRKGARRPVCGKLADWYVLTREIPEIIFLYQHTLAKVLHHPGKELEKKSWL